MNQAPGMLSMQLHMVVKKEIKFIEILAKILRLNCLSPIAEQEGMCAQHIFLSSNLAKLLFEKNLTLLGTIRAHCRETPTTLNNRIELFSSVFLYNHEDDVYLVAYLAKSNKKTRSSSELNSYRKFCYY